MARVCFEFLSLCFSLIRVEFEILLQSALVL
jgi:hypothetical protein